MQQYNNVGTMVQSIMPNTTKRRKGQRVVDSKPAFRASPLTKDGTDTATATAGPIPYNFCFSSNQTDTILRRGRVYPRAQHNFDFDSSSSLSHWRRINCLHRNVLRYLVAHGLSLERAEKELNREYVQRYKLVQIIGDDQSVGSGLGGAVFEVDTDWGRRVQVYELCDRGFDEQVPDGSVIYGKHVSRGLASSHGGNMQRKQSKRSPEKMVAASVSSLSPSPIRRHCKIHRRTHWEGRSHISSTISPEGGLMERTERYLASATKTLTKDERGLLPPGSDDTIMVVERTYAPLSESEGGKPGVTPEVVSCREIFVRCFRNSEKECATNFLPVLSCPFADVCPNGVSGQHQHGTKEKMRVRTILIPVEAKEKGYCKEKENRKRSSDAIQFRVIVEGDASDLFSRGILGLLVDAVKGKNETAKILLSDDFLRLDAESVSKMIGIGPSDHIELVLETIKRQISDLLLNY